MVRSSNGLAMTPIRGLAPGKSCGGVNENAKETVGYRQERGCPKGLRVLRVPACTLATPSLVNVQNHERKRKKTNRGGGVARVHAGTRSTRSLLFGAPGDPATF